MKYINKNSGTDVFLPRGIVLTNVERMQMNRIIADYIKQVYPFANDDPPVIMGGKRIVPEYILKAINNRLLLQKIVFDSDNKIISGVRTKEDLFRFVKDNLYDLFNYNGIYFNDIYMLLANSSRKGKKFENKAYLAFEEKAKEKGVDIKVEPPSSIEEDKDQGIDGKFTIGSKIYTIQVKPLERIEDKGDSYHVHCRGNLQVVKTDYLITNNDNETYIFRGKGIVVNPGYFLIPKINLV